MDTEVWLFFPAELRTASALARNTIRQTCKARNWHYQERQAKRTPNGLGGTVRLIDARDAIAVYRRMHRSRVAVLCADAPRICVTYPEDRAVRRGDTISLSNYCLYKAYRSSSQTINNLSTAWVEEFSAWLESIHCENEHDPRCLPFPIFEANDDTFLHLTTANDRQVFERQHHARGRGRTDRKGLRWELNPTVFHGHDQLNVAGRMLPRGMHWDVQNANGRPVTIGSPTEKWVVMEYINVFPDGTFRANRGKAKKK